MQELRRRPDVGGFAPRWLSEQVSHTYTDLHSSHSQGFVPGAVGHGVSGGRCGKEECFAHGGRIHLSNLLIETNASCQCDSVGEEPVSSPLRCSWKETKRGVGFQYCLSAARLFYLGSALDKIQWFKTLNPRFSRDHYRLARKDRKLTLQ